MWKLYSRDSLVALIMKHFNFVIRRFYMEVSGDESASATKHKEEIDR